MEDGCASLAPAIPALPALCPAGTKDGQMDFIWSLTTQSAAFSQLTAEPLALMLRACTIGHPIPSIGAGEHRFHRLLRMGTVSSIGPVLRNSALAILAHGYR